jgi:hypothetical protein
MPESEIPDDEVVYHRVPPGKDWFAPPDRVSSLNFKLRPGEIGISVYRASIVDVRGVLNKPGAIPGSGVSQATVGQIRAARDKKGTPLELDVVPVDDEDDPGHAEIRGPRLHQDAKVAAKVLKEVFTLTQAPS